MPVPDVRIPFLRDIRALIKEQDKDIGRSDVGLVKDKYDDGTALVEITVIHDYTGQPQQMSHRNVPIFWNVGDVEVGDKVSVLYIDGDLSDPYIVGVIKDGEENKDKQIIKWIMALKSIGAN